MHLFISKEGNYNETNRESTMKLCRKKKSLLVHILFGFMPLQNSIASLVPCFYSSTDYVHCSKIL